MTDRIAFALANILRGYGGGKPPPQQLGRGVGA